MLALETWLCQELNYSKNYLCTKIDSVLVEKLFKKNLYKNSFDNVCVLIQNKCVVIALWSTRMTRAEFHERNKTIHISASYIVFLFVKLENNNFIKEIKNVLSAFIVLSCENLGNLLSNSSKHSPCFSSGYEGIQKMVFFLKKIPSIIKEVKRMI